MDEPIVVRYQPSLQGYIAAQETHHRTTLRPLFRNMLIVLIVFLWIMSAVVLILSRGHEWTSIALVGIITVGLLLSQWFNRLYYRSIYMKIPLRDLEIEMKVFSDRFMSNSAAGNGETTWEAFLKVVESREMFLLYLQPNLFVWLSKRAFPDEATLLAFTELVKSKVPQYKVIK